MIQQLIAIIIIAFFISRVFQQKKKNEIGKNEFTFWLGFWTIAGLAIVFIKTIDKAVMFMGFSGSGINFLFYIAVMMLFYLIFKMRLRIVKLEKQITDVVREVALKK
ncbi:MAG: DUF2304 domain-containing protein [Candidatus Falkowbacteria bacterium]